MLLSSRMKADIHAQNYRQVIFKDESSDARFLVFSAVETDKKDKWEDGKEYDMYETEISSASHPFYTGKENSLDRAGRAEKFRARMAKRKPVAPVQDTTEE